MKILHYALGFPPYRSGGLTKFCIDLMTQQAKDNHEVAMLWPGQIGFINNKTSIKNRGNVSLGDQIVQSFEVINPLPVSLDEGIADISAFVTDAGREVYDKLLDDFHPDVLHVHTLMGLHKSLLKACKDRQIRLVFTAHDFFPICPKVTMFRHGAVCDCVQSCENCGVCNTTALSLKKIRILQSPLYRKLKDGALVKKMRKQHRDSYLSESTVDDFVDPEGTSKDYKELRNYYYSLLKLMDMIHYNSSVTKKVYESVFDIPNSCIMGITHSDIKDNRTVRHYNNKELRIRYLGPNSGAKGYLILKSALDELWNQKKNFCLDVHFVPNEISPYMKIHQRYSYLNLKDIFDETDILVAPSIWYETFGFTVIEALSYGVPVLISSTVGAKEVMAQGAGIVLEDINAQKICAALRELTAEQLASMNKVITEKQRILTISEMSKKIEKILY